MLFELLLVGLFAAHLLFVDIAMAGPLVCVWLDWRARRYQDPAAHQIGRRLAGRVVLAFFVALALGGVMWAVMRYLAPGHERFLHVFEALPFSRVIGMASELTFFAVVMAVYAATWNAWQKWRWLHRTLAIVAGTTLLSHFPPLFTMLSVLGTRAELAGQLLERDTYRSLLFDPEVLARTAHHVCASFAVVGIIVGCKGAQRGGLRSGTDSPTAADPQAVCVGVSGARLALIATLLQLPIGAFVFTQLPAPAREIMMGNDILGTVLFLAALVSALGLMHHLAALALGDLRKSKVYTAGILLIATTLLMTGMLHRSRAAVYQQLNLIQGVTEPAK